MRLRSQMIHLSGLDGADELDQARGVGHVPVVEVKRRVRRAVCHRIGVQMGYTGRVEGGGAPDHPVHLVAFGEEKLCQVGPVLARDTSNQGHLRGTVAGQLLGLDRFLP